MFRHVVQPDEAPQCANAPEREPEEGAIVDPSITKFRQVATKRGGRRHERHEQLRKEDLLVICREERLGKQDMDMVLNNPIITEEDEIAENTVVEVAVDSETVSPNAESSDSQSHLGVSSACSNNPAIRIQDVRSVKHIITRCSRKFHEICEDHLLDVLRRPQRLNS